MLKNYTYEDMINLDSNPNIKFFNLFKDFVIKSIFSNNKDLLKNFLILQIKDVIELDPDTTTITIGNVELGKSNYKEYNKIIDTYVILNNNIHINLEFNSSPYSVASKRNNQYLNKLCTKVLETGDKISKLNNIYVIQLNLNASKKDNKFGDDVIIHFGKKTCKFYPNFQYIVLKNIEYYRNLFYNGYENLQLDELCHIVISSRNFEELFFHLNLVVNDEVKNKLLKEVIDMFSDGFLLSQWEKDKLDALLMYEFENYIKEQENDIKKQKNHIEEQKNHIEEQKNHIKEQENHIKEQENQIKEQEKNIRNESREEGIISTIKSMIKNKLTLEVISKITGKSIKELKNIQKNMI